MKFIQPSGEDQLVDGDVGQSVMEVAIANDVAGITAECGGAASCGTCHIHVAETWAGMLDMPSDMEEQMLEFVIDPAPTSRLACQIPVTDEIDGIVFRLPAEG